MLALPVKPDRACRHLPEDGPAATGTPAVSPATDSIAPSLLRGSFAEIVCGRGRGAVGSRARGREGIGGAVTEGGCYATAYRGECRRVALLAISCSSCSDREVARAVKPVVEKIAEKLMDNVGIDLMLQGLGPVMLTSVIGAAADGRPRSSQRVMRRRQLAIAANAESAGIPVRPVAAGSSQPGQAAPTSPRRVKVAITSAALIATADRPHA